MLLAGGADVGALTASGLAPIHCATMAREPGHPSSLNKREVVQLLAAAGADVGGPGGDGWSAIIHAAQTGAVDAILGLVEAGADVNATTPNEGWTALHLAAGWDKPEAIEALVSAGANLEQRDKKGRTPLLHGVEYSKVDASQALLAAGCSVAATDHDRQPRCTWRRCRAAWRW